ncbi:MAG: T9SS type A sorting domain-containing protein [Chitinophagaceae bacterium]|nr:T9SS type A sorting domain-containing protein [Chitinophagaceae bacterium]
MNWNIVFGVLIFILIGYLESWSQSVFNRSVDSNLAIQVNGLLVIDNDNRFFITSSDIGADPLLIKCDLDGNVIWQQQQNRLGTKKSVLFGQMLQLDTTFLMFGLDEYKHSSILMHFTRSGDLIDHKLFKPVGVSEVKSAMIARTDDNHIVLAGALRDNHKEDRIMWLRTTNEGDILNAEILSSHKDIYLVKLLPLKNMNGALLDDVIVATYAGDLIPTDQPLKNFPRLFRIDSNGADIWVKDFVLSYNVALTDIIQVSDGGYVMIGNGLQKSFIFKTNAAFEPQWMKTAEFTAPSFPGPFPGFYALLEMSGNHNLVIGGAQRYNTADVHALLVETDENGNLLEARLDSNGIVIAKMAAMPNRFILLAGRDKLNQLRFSSLDSNSNYACPLTPVSLNWYDDEMPIVIEKELILKLYDNESLEDTLKFVRLDQSFDIYNGCEGVNAVLEMESVAGQLKLYPNPVQTQLTITATSILNDVIVRVYDLQGRMQDCEFWILDFGLNNSIQLNTENLPDGFYTLQIINSKTGRIEIGKFVKAL